jgi:hypothetical protein
MFWWEWQKVKGHYEDGVGGRIILIRIIEKYDMVVWIGFIWLRIGTSDGLL